MTDLKPVVFTAPVTQADGSIIYAFFKTEADADAARELFEKQHAERHAEYLRSIGQNPPE